MERYLRRTFLFITISYVVLLLINIISNASKVPSLPLFSFEILLMIGFLAMMWGCLNTNISKSKTYVFIYQLVAVMALYVFYNVYYGTGMGYNPADAYTYNKYASWGSKMNLSSFLFILKNLGFSYSDWGFFIIGKYVYSLPGDGLFNMKIVNIIFHYFTAIGLYKTALLITNKEVSKYIFIFYGLNPLSTYFCSSGLKEITFAFFVVWSFYWLYKYILSNNYKHLVISFLISSLIIFFRPLVFLCFFGSIVMYFFVNYKGKHRVAYNIVTLLILGLLAYYMRIVLQDEIDGYMNANIALADEEKLQSTSTGIEIGTFKLVNIFVGFFGPFPTYMQLGGKDIEMIQSVGVYLKCFLSVFCLFFCSFIILKRHIKYIPIVTFYIFYTIVLIVSSFSFDIRFHYPYLALFSLGAIIGMDLINRQRLWWIANTYFAVLMVALFVWNRRV